MSNKNHQDKKQPGLLQTIRRKGFFRVQLYWFLAVSLIPLATASYINYRSNHETLKKEIITHLQDTARHQTKEIEDFFDDCLNSLNGEARRENVRIQLQTLTNAFKTSGQDLQDFIYSGKWKEITDKTADQFEYFLSINEFYDVLLIDADGNILYSATEEPDLGTNIFTGPYAQTHFGLACRTAFQEKRSVFSDFDKYSPSNNTKACFLVSPVYSLAGDISGLMAIQLSTTQIDQIMISNDPTSGVDSFLVGHDLLIRSRSTLTAPSSPIEAKIDTEKTRAWLKYSHKWNSDDTRQGVTSIYRNHDNNEVLGLFSAIEVTNVPLAVITEIPVAKAFQDVNRQTRIAIKLFFTVAFIVLCLALWAARMVTRPLHILTRQANRIAAGDLEVLPDAITKTDDEFGILNESFQKIAASLQFIASVCSDISLGIFDRTITVRSNKDILSISVNQMIASFQNVIDQANSISNGDFSINITPRSEQDSLSIALRTMAIALEEQNWIKTGIAEINICMQGEQDIDILGRNVMDFICTYLQVQIGAFFIRSGNKLRLQAGYALDSTQGYDKDFTMGEGLVGQAALDKKTIVFNHVPPDHVDHAINSGLGFSPPSSIIVLPLNHKGTIVGVMEFGSSREFSNLEQSFLELITESIAINIHTAQARQELQSLLEETQRQSEELQSQQEELRVANEELEEQSEELRAANEELEEKTEYLEKQRQEITQAQTTLEIKADELTQASKYKSEFLANMSHELRSPLNSLLILARSLAENDEGNFTPDQLEAARIIYSSGRDQLNLINDILDLSKVEAGRLEIHHQDLQLAHLQNDIEDRFSHLAKEKGLIFSVHFSSALPQTICTDDQRLKQVIDNLLSNAIKFTSQGSVTLEAKPAVTKVEFKQPKLQSAEKIICFTVIDTGIGISSDKQDSIFEAFRQEDGSTSRSYGGTGLGLTISRQLAWLLGGEIHLNSSQGEGCTFSLYLPIIEATNILASPPSPCKSQDKVNRPTRQDPPNPAPTSPPTTSNCLDDDRQTIHAGDKSLLIIEDDAIFAQVICQMARDKGYQALIAADGNSGILLAKEYQPKAIILDLGLPDLDGMNVLEKLKNDADTKHIPVHIVSATKESSLPLLKGAIGFLSKPATQKNLTKVFDQFEKIIQGQVKKLLIIDDDKISRDNIKKLLTPQGIEIITAATGENAYQIMCTEAFDCIILDLGLPDMSGFDLMTKIDQEESIAKVPVIVYTARDLTEEENDILYRHARTVVVKGVDSNERLLDEVSLFMHSMNTTLPNEQQNMIKMIHDSNETLQDKKILLVDDDMRNTFALSGLLQKIGMQVVMAANGQQALDKLDGEEFDMVLMDIMMPVMDGYEATREIKKQPRFKDLPIIALTAKAMPEDRQICLEAGANDYLAKPINQEQLLSLMRVWLFK